MKKQNKFLLATLMAAPVLFTACQFEDDDYFDQSASLRVENTNETVKNLLVKPANGWVMQYFTGTGVAHFEGFNLFAKFDASMKVSMAGNHRLLRNGNAGKYTEHSSVYSLLLEDGPVLALNTWNDVLSPFVDPVDPWKAPSLILKDGAGMQGDNNFVIVKHNDNEIIMRGERYSAEVRLVACDRPWKDYITACDNMKKAIAGTITSFYLTDDTETLYLTGISGGRVRMSERLEDPIKRDSLACVFTPNGIRFEKEDTIGNSAFQEFMLSADKSELVTADGKAKIRTTWDEYMLSHNGVFNFDESFYTAEQLSIVSSINTEVKKFNNSWSLKSIGLGKGAGTNSANGLVLTFYNNAAKTKESKSMYNIIQEIVSYGKIAISPTDTPSYDNNLKLIADKAPNMLVLLQQFVNTLKGKYNVVPNDYFSPTGATYNAYEGGNTFKLK